MLSARVHAALTSAIVYKGCAGRTGTVIPCNNLLIIYPYLAELPVAHRPLAEQREPKWLIVYGILVICVICISLARALAFFEATFRYSSLLA